MDIELRPIYRMWSRRKRKEFADQSGFQRVAKDPENSGGNDILQCLNNSCSDHLEAELDLHQGHIC